MNGSRRHGARRRGSAIAAAVALLVLALVAGAPPAGAHGGAGEISVIDSTEVAPLQVELVVGIRYVLDRHPAAPATFVVSGTGPGGAVLESRSLERTDSEGVYEVSLTFPVAGSWELTFQSSLPPGELEHGLEVLGEATPTAPTSTTPAPTAAPDATATTAPPASGTDGSSDTTEAVDPSEQAEGTLVDSGGGSGPPTLLVVGLIVTGLLIVVAGLVVLRTVLRGRQS